MNKKKENNVDNKYYKDVSKIKISERRKMN